MNLIASIGLDYHAFFTLLQNFKLFYPKNRLRRAGRKRRLEDVTDVLGLVLTFYSDKQRFNKLGAHFGIGMAVLSRTLKLAEACLNVTLRHMVDARICWPSKELQKDWARRVNEKYNLVTGRFCFIDGKNLKVQNPTSSDLQNAMYNGWLHAVLVTGCLCFGVDGTIIWAKHNCPGSWNDGEVSRQFQEKLLDDNLVEEDHGALSDSAFPVGKLMFGKIMTPLKEGDLERAMEINRETVPALIALSGQITSARQAAEWGMGSIEKPFPRILEPLPYNQKLRRVRLENLFRLYNFRVRKTGISQIRTYFFS
jgi:hypothetical protein